jgi:MFS family permease
MLVAAPYRSLFCLPGVPRLVGATFVGGVAAAMLPLAIVLTVKEAAGSFGVAGAAAAAFAAANAASAPLRGRVIDRQGFGGLPAIAAGRAIALLALVAVAAGRAGAPLLIAVAAVAGFLQPPMLQALRRAWVELIDDRALRETAYALQAVLADALFIAGPAAAGLLSANAGAESVLLLAAACGLAGAVLFGSPPLHGAAQAREPRSGTTALVSPGIAVVVVTSVCLGGVLGAFDVAALAFADSRGALAAGSLAVALVGAGSMLGGLTFGSRRWSASPPSRYLVALATLTGGFSLVALAESTLALAALAALAGVAVAPATATAYTLIEDLAPADTGSEAVGWIAMGFALGSACGAAAAGALAASSLALAMALPAAFSAAALAIATGGRPALRSVRTHHSAVST